MTARKKTKIKPVLLIFLLIGVIYSNIVFAIPKKIEIQFEHITLKEGLTKLQLLSIIQDTTGFMWFGTNRGLFRYDGNEFKHFVHTANTDSSLYGRRIFTFYIDKQGILWVGTDKGLNQYNNQNHIFTHYTYQDNGIRKIFECHNGNLWILLNNRKFGQFNRQSNTFKIFKNHRFKAIINYNKDALWLGGGTGIKSFDIKKKTFTPINLDCLENCAVWSLYEDINKNIWIGTDASLLYKYDRKTKNISKFQLPGTRNKILDISEYNTNYLLLSTTYDGLILLNKKNGSFQSSHNQNDKLTGINSNHVQNTYVDRSDVIWVGTILKGLFKSKPVNKFNHINTKNSNLSDNFINTIHEEKTGIIWIGTNKGLDRYDPINDSFIHYKNIPGDNRSLSNNSVLSILKDRYDDLWVGTKIGLNKFDKKNSNFIRYELIKEKTNVAGMEFINVIYEDKKGVIWIGTLGGGLFKYNREESSFSNFQDYKDSHIFCLAEDSAGVFWLGTYNQGISIFDRKTEKFVEHYKLDDDNPKSLSSNEVNVLFCDNDNNIWIGTRSRGLNKFNREDKTFTKYMDVDGLPSNSILGIVGDDNLWISTTNGLSKFNKKKKIFTNFTKKEGVKCYWPETKNNKSPSVFPPREAILRTKSGTIYISGKNGINYFDPKKLEIQGSDSPIILSNFKLFNKTYPLSKDYSLIDEITLSYKDYIFGFKFSFLDFSAPEQNQYAFKLEGHDLSWNYTGTNSNVTYTNIKPGHYTMRAKGASVNGVWNEPGTVIKLTITPPFWQTKWFYLLCFISLILLILAIIRIRTRVIENQKKVLINEVRQKTNELQKAHDGLEKTVAIRTKEIVDANIELENNKIKLTQNLLQQELLSEISIIFNSLQNFTNKMNIVLKLLGMYTETDRVYFYRNDPGNETGRLTNEWLKKDITSLIDERSRIKYDIIPEWKHILLQRGHIEITDSANASKRIKEILESKHTISLIIFPIYIGKQLFGILGLDSCKAIRKWTDTEKNLISTVANIISNSIEKEQIEESLAKSEQTARTLLNAPEDPATLLDTNGKILSINKAMEKQLKIEAKEYSGMSINKIFPKKISKTRMQYFLKCVETGNPTHFEDKFKKKTYRHNLYPVIDQNNKIRSIAFYSRDVSKEKRAEEILREHRQELEELVNIRTAELKETNRKLINEINFRKEAESNLIISEREKRENLRKLTLQLAHEVKNPLTGIKSSAELMTMLQKNRQKSGSDRHIAIIKKNVDICNQVVRDLYNFTHISKLNLETIYYSSISEQMRSYVYEKCEQYPNLRINFNNYCNNIKISADEFRLLQALKNIIDNSFDAISDRGNINWISNCNEQNVLIEISDDGEGIPVKELNKIFEPFYSTKSKGFGLGLSLVKEIITVHKGQISMNSKINKGSKVMINLPLVN